MSKIADEAESQEYVDAVEKLEPEIDDLASRIVDNLNIEVSSPDDNALCNRLLYSSFCNRILYFFLNEDPLSLLMSSLSRCLSLAYSLNELSK